MNYSETIQKLAKRSTDMNMPVNLWLSRLIGIFIFFSAAIITGQVTFVIKSGYIEATAKKMRSETETIAKKAGFYLDEILVQGRKRTESKELLKAVSLDRGIPIMSIDLNEVKSRIETLPWVKVAVVERKLPSVIHIIVEEREPIAIWQNGGRFVPIDKNGYVINASIDNLKHLPVVVGEKAPEYAETLLSSIKNEPELSKRMKAAVLVGERRWDVVIDDVKNGIAIKLPEAETDKAWARLAKIEREHGILKRKLTMIDLRLNDRLVVRVADGDKIEDLNKSIAKKGRKT